MYFLPSAIDFAANILLYFKTYFLLVQRYTDIQI